MPLANYTTIVTSGGTTTLDVDSPRNILFTGTGGTIVLPVVSTLEEGLDWQFFNNTSGILTVNSSGGSLVSPLDPGTALVFTCIAITGTDETSWQTSNSGTFGNIFMRNGSNIGWSRNDGSWNLGYSNGLASYFQFGYGGDPALISADGTGVVILKVPNGVGGGTLQFPLVPTSTTKVIATLDDVAEAIQDFDIKDPVNAATTAALPFSPTYANGSSGVGATLTGTVGILAFDGYTPALNDRILIKNQASTFQNGIYKVTTVGTALVGYVLTRATDFNQTANIIYGDTVGVLNGTVNANQQFTMNNNNAITVGTTAITFAQTSGGSQLVAGTGMSIVGNTLAVTGAPVLLTPRTINGVSFDGSGNITTTHPLTVYAAGTEAILSGTPAVLNFGTTDPILVLDNAGTYLIQARVAYYGDSGSSSPTFKLRRTNNTAADINNSSTSLDIVDPINSPGVATVLPPVIYTTANTDDSISIFGSGNATTVSEASIVAIRLS
jgi:hypothetical protein